MRTVCLSTFRIDECRSSGSGEHGGAGRSFNFPPPLLFGLGETRMAVASTPRKVLSEIHENVAGGPWNTPAGPVRTNATSLEEYQDAAAAGEDAFPRSASKVAVESMMQEMEEEGE